MPTLLRTLLIWLLVPAAVAFSQDNPFSAYNKVVYGGVKKYPAPLSRKNARGELQL